MTFHYASTQVQLHILLRDLLSLWNRLYVQRVMLKLFEGLLNRQVFSEIKIMLKLYILGSYVFFSSWEKSIFFDFALLTEEFYNYFDRGFPPRSFLA